jgi:hypothetical protein
MQNTVAQNRMQPEPWAVEEFGAATLGNSLRTARLVTMAMRAAEVPGGRLTEVFSNKAELEGAYRLVENNAVAEQEIALAAHMACARRCADHPFVLIPMDGCTLTMTDVTGAKGFGKVGTAETRGRGIEVMNAIAVTPEGTPVGLCGQIWWTRRDEPVSIPSRLRQLHEKETRYWVKGLEAVNAAFAAAGVNTQRWFQVDAGADFREWLALASETEHLITVRAAQDRRLDETDARLWQQVGTQATLGRIDVKVPRGRKRKPRTAHIELKSCPITLKLPGGLGPAPMWAVLATEVGTTPKGEEPIEWLLLTNMEVKGFDDAQVVVYGYTQRWRIEDFHKSWKSVCKVEESQLEVTAFKPWATILASVAIRIERLKHLARNEPEQPATVELSETEVEATLVLYQTYNHRMPKDHVEGRMPTIAQAVTWIAELGGYTGPKRSHGPPGTIVIGRGLARLEIAAQVLTGLAMRQQQR